MTQERVADAITRFAGSMRFVYLHVVLFSLWLTVFERSPWQVLTMIVSLEAIFLSTFVMISQNRADRIAAALAEEGRRVGREDRDLDAEALRITLLLCRALGVDTEEEPVNGTEQSTPGPQYCPRCGTANSASAAYCIGCGARMS